MFNELLSSLNWLAILAGAVAFWILGSIWYSALFSKPWVKMHGVNVDNPDAKKGMALMFTGSFVLMFVASTGIALLLQLLPAGDVGHAAKLGLLVSVCFSFTAMAVNYVYLKKPLGLYLIDGGYHVVGCVLSAIIIKLLS
jgi:hypothetical protein